MIFRNDLSLKRFWDIKNSLDNKLHTAIQQRAYTAVIYLKITAQLLWIVRKKGIPEDKLCQKFSMSIDTLLTILGGDCRGISLNQLCRLFSLWDGELCLSKFCIKIQLTEEGSEKEGALAYWKLEERDELKEQRAIICKRLRVLGKKPILKPLKDNNPWEKLLTRIRNASLNESDPCSTALDDAHSDDNLCS